MTRVTVEQLTEHVPHELRTHPGWVLWKLEPGGKVPYQPKLTQHKAKVNDRTTWGTWEQTLAAYQKADWAQGVGFVFLRGWGFVGVDLDDAPPEAFEAVRQAATYVEKSPGGKGLHAICRGSKPAPWMNRDGVEIYDGARFFTMTGETLNGWEPDRPLGNAQPLLQALIGVLPEPSKLTPKDYMLFDTPGPIPDGQRHAALKSLVGLLVSRRLSPDTIRATCRGHYTSGKFAAATPWTEEHLEQQVTSLLSNLQARVTANAGANATIAEYEEALSTSGWSFARDMASDRVLVDGVPLDDFIQAQITRELNRAGFKNESYLRTGLLLAADQHRVHPVLDALKSFTWDGQDHIGLLAAHLEDIDANSPWVLRRWLLGAVGRLLDNGARNRMLVLRGRQSMGKSYLARWLGRPFPGYGSEAAVDVDDKDSTIRLVETFVWEVAELGGTMRRVDRNALKAYLSREQVKVRRPYARLDIHKPAMASFIGTTNDAAFLDDPTGNDRYLVLDLAHINWDYASAVDAEQVWAQTLALYVSGERGELSPEEREAMGERLHDFDLPDPLQDSVAAAVVNDPERYPEGSTLTEIWHMVGMPADRGMGDREVRALVEALTRMGARQKRMRLTGNAPKTRRWLYIGPLKDQGDLPL